MIQHARVDKPRVLRVLASAALAGAAATLLVGSVHAASPQLIHEEAIFEPPARPPIAEWTKPSEFGARRVLDLKRPDGAVLRGWLYPAPHQGAPYLLMFCGNGESISQVGRRAAWLRQLGLTVILFDYRGYGFSDGKPHLPAIQEDALAEYDLASKLSEADGAGGSLLVYGFSLGTTFAIRVAAEREARGLILLAPIASAKEELNVMLARGAPAALRAAVQFAPDSTLTNALNNVEAIKQYSGSLLVMHGAEDALIPPEQGRAVLEASAAADRKFELLPGIHHNDAFFGDTAAGRAVEAFVAKFRTSGLMDH